MLDPEGMRRVFRYDAGDALDYVIWLLSQPTEITQDGATPALKALEAAFEFRREPGVHGHDESSAAPPPIRCRWSLWLTPTLLPNAPSTLWDVTLNVAKQWTDTAVRPYAHYGMYFLAQLDDDVVIVLGEDGAWHGPFEVELPERSDAYTSLVEGYIPIDGSEVDTSELALTIGSAGVVARTQPVYVSIAPFVNGYGPHAAVVVVGAREEMQAYEIAEDLKRTGEYFTSEREELIRDLVREGLARDTDAFYDRFEELLHEDIQLTMLKLPVWEAAAYAMQLQHHDFSEDIVEEGHNADSATDIDHVRVLYDYDGPWANQWRFVRVNRQNNIVTSDVLPTRTQDIVMRLPQGHNPWDIPPWVARAMPSNVPIIRAPWYRLTVQTPNGQWVPTPDLFHTSAEAERAGAIIEADWTIEEDWGT